MFTLQLHHRVETKVLHTWSLEPRQVSVLLVGRRSLFGIEQSVAEVLIIGGRGDKELGGHVSVVDPGRVERRHHTLNLAVVVENLLFGVALLIGGIAPAETLP